MIFVGWLACTVGMTSLTAVDVNRNLVAVMESSQGCTRSAAGEVRDVAGNMLWHVDLPDCDWSKGEVKWEEGTAVFRCAPGVEVRSEPWQPR